MVGWTLDLLLPAALGSADKAPPLLSQEPVEAESVATLLPGGGGALKVTGLGGVQMSF